MKLNLSTNDVIQTIMTLITAVGILIAVSANRAQMKTFNEQLKLNFFADYTKRYQEIALNFPDNIHEPGFDFQELEPRARTNAMKYMRAYFNLCSEEFHLNKQSYIDPTVWALWKGGMEYSLKKKGFQDAWKIIARDTKYDPEFKSWADAQLAPSEI